MPGMLKARSEEFHNLRPVILVVCFFWGVGAGFALNFFRAPQSPADDQAQTQPAVAVGQPENAAGPLSDAERRYAGAPTIAAIEPAPAPAAPDRFDFESMAVDAPPVILTTDGGLSGRNAKRPRTSSLEPPSPHSGLAQQPYQPASSPPIPDLSP